MKKIIAPLLASCLCLSVPVLATAPESPILQETQSTVGGSCGHFLTWSYDTTTATMTISGTGAMTDYPNYAPPGWTIGNKSKPLW